MVDRLVAILPEVLRVAAESSPPMQALAAVAEDLHDPVHGVLDTLPQLIDPHAAPAGMLRYLAYWVDLGWLLAPGLGTGGGAAPTDTRLRDLVFNAAELSARRGTAAGLCRFLHLATGAPRFGVVPGDGDFTITVLAPPAAEPWLPLVRRIVAAAKPAHVSAVVTLRDQPPAPAEGEP